MPIRESKYNLWKYVTRSAKLANLIIRLQAHKTKTRKYREVVIPAPLRRQGHTTACIRSDANLQVLGVLPGLMAVHDNMHDNRHDRGLPAEREGVW